MLQHPQRGSTLAIILDSLECYNHHHQCNAHAVRVQLRGVLLAQHPIPHKQDGKDLAQRTLPDKAVVPPEQSLEATSHQAGGPHDPVGVTG